MNYQPEKIKMKRHTGFTLIELVIVIIVLGILSATAVAKFINLKVDARNAALSGMKGSLESAINISYAKMVIAGKDKTFQVRGTEAGEIIKGCDDCTFFYGYMPADIKTLSVMVDSIRTDNSGDFVVTKLETEAANVYSVYITFPNNITDRKTLKSESCYIKYIAGISPKNAKPVLELNKCS